MEDLNLNFSVDGQMADVSTEPEMPSSFEEATKEEISEVLAAFRKRAKDEAEAKKNNTSTEYWFAVYFANQAQRDAFLRAINLIEKLQDQYIAGDEFAKAVGVDIPNEQILIPKSFRRPAGIDDLIIEI